MSNQMSPEDEERIQEIIRQVNEGMHDWIKSGVMADIVKFFSYSSCKTFDVVKTKNKILEIFKNSAAARRSIHEALQNGWGKIEYPLPYEVYPKCMLTKHFASLIPKVLLKSSSPEGACCIHALIFVSMQ